MIWCRIIDLTLRHPYLQLDLVIESNASTIVILENVQKKMSRMSPEELAKFTLDDNLGGTSSTIHVKAIRR